VTRVMTMPSLDGAFLSFKANAPAAGKQEEAARQTPLAGHAKDRYIVGAPVEVFVPSPRQR